MEKPNSMSVKEWLMKKVAIELKHPDKVVSTVISDSFEQANNATLNYNSIELSGFGKFFFNIEKAKKTLEASIIRKEGYEKDIESGTLTEVEKRKKGLSLHAVIMEITKLNAKL